MTRLSSLFLLLAAVTFVGCGGGGVTSAVSTIPPVTPVVQGNPEGAYLGTTPSGETFETIILPDDTFYGLYGTTSGNVFTVQGMLTGKGSYNNGTYTASETDYNATGAMYTGTVNATYVVGSSFSGMITESGNPTMTFSGSPMAGNHYTFATPALLSNITGAWAGFLFGDAASQVTITANGAFSGTNEGCTFTGTITPDPSGSNYFDFSTEYGASCLLSNQTQTGIAVDYLLPDGVTRQLITAVSSDSSANVFVANNTLAITNTALPSGQVGTAYNATLAATGGTAPYTWSLTSGTLPAGLTLSGGAITGTPTSSVDAVELTFAVSDSSNPVQTKSASLSLTISPAPPATLSITTSSLPNAQVGTAYSTTLAATGGTLPYSWTSGTLPAGLTLNAATGIINGIPTATATTTLTFTVTDSGSPAQTKSVNLTLTITATTISPPAALMITTTSLPPGTLGSPYSVTLTATGGTAPYTWVLTSGTLPAGLSLASSAIAGIPTAVANATPLTLTVTDASSVQTNSVNLTLTITYASNTTLVSSAQTIPAGASVTFTATVTAPTAPTGTIPTGTVMFMDGTLILGGGGLGAAAYEVATFTTTALPIGSNSVTAEYFGGTEGDTLISGSTSNAVTVAVSDTAVSEFK
jgi:Bacterial Ig-like domain (group 3)/Putative Ig domain